MSDHIMLSARVFNTPHLIDPAKLQAICFAMQDKLQITVAEPAEHVMRPQASVGRWEGMDRKSGMIIDGGVGIIPITGTLVNRGAWIGTSSGLQSYDGIAQQLRMAAENRSIHSVILDLNTYGGEAAGVADLGSEIRDLSARKRVVALVADHALSGGYWIAAAAPEIVTTETGSTGSIGVVLTHQDVSEAAERAGIRITHIYAGADKTLGSPFRQLSDEDAAKLQASVDQLYEMFTSRVDAYRGGKLTSKSIGARLFRGQDAVKAGLADRVMSGRALLAEMQKATGRRSSRMTDDDKLYTESEVAAKVSAATTALKAEHETAQKSAVDAAVTSERERIASINQIAQAGFEKDRDAAIAEGTAPGEFAVQMLKLADERGVTLAGMRAGSPEVVPHANAPEKEGRKTAQIDTGAIYAARKKED